MLHNGISSISGRTVMLLLLDHQYLVSVKQGVPWAVNVGSWVGEALRDASLHFRPQKVNVFQSISLYETAVFMCI
jgi:hypothetical protein